MNLTLMAHGVSFWQIFSDLLENAETTLKELLSFFENKSAVLIGLSIHLINLDK